jgi:hypothetical protein
MFIFLWLWFIFGAKQLLYGAGQIHRHGVFPYVGILRIEFHPHHDPVSAMPAGGRTRCRQSKAAFVILTSSCEDQLGGGNN